MFELKNGNQVCADAVILKGDCEVNESLLTGESDPVYRKCGDEVLSGSYIVSGSVLARAVHVGKDNYVSKITGQAKYIKKPNSEMLRSIRMIIKIISILLIPVAACLFYNQMEVPGIGLKSAVVSTVAAVIGMIPSGSGPADQHGTGGKCNPAWSEEYTCAGTVLHRNPCPCGYPLPG